MVLLKLNTHISIKQCYCHIFTILIKQFYAIHLCYVVFHVQCSFILNKLYIYTVPIGCELIGIGEVTMPGGGMVVMVGAAPRDLGMTTPGPPITDMSACPPSFGLFTPPSTGVTTPGGWNTVDSQYNKYIIQGFPWHKILASLSHFLSIEPYNKFQYVHVDATLQIW